MTTSPIDYNDIFSAIENKYKYIDITTVDKDILEKFTYDELIHDKIILQNLPRSPRHDPNSNKPYGVYVDCVLDKINILIEYKHSCITENDYKLRHSLIHRLLPVVIGVVLGAIIRDFGVVLGVVLDIFNGVVTWCIK